MLCMCCVPALAFAKGNIPEPLPDNIGVYDDTETGIKYVYMVSTQDNTATLGYICLDNMKEGTTEVNIPSTVSYKDTSYTITSLNPLARITDEDGYFVAYVNGTNLSQPNIFAEDTAWPQGIDEKAKSITSVIIPSTVKETGRYCFRYCTGLKTVTFAEGSQYEKMETFAFDHCTSLENIVLPEGLKTIVQASEASQTQQFGGCTSLKSIFIPASVEALPGGMFGDYGFYCTNLEKIEFGKGSKCTLPENFTLLGDCKIETFTLPDGLDWVSMKAFGRATKLKEIIIPYTKDTSDESSTAKFTFHQCGKYDQVQSVNNIVFTGDLDEIALGSTDSAKNFGAATSINFIFTGNVSNVKMPDPGCFSSLTSKSFAANDPEYSDAEGAENAALPTWCNTANYKYAQIKKFVATLNGPSIYTGGPVDANITVTGGGRELVEGVDYKLTYENNVEIAATKDAASVTITPLSGEFYGSEQTLRFDVVGPEGKNHWAQELAGDSRYDTALAEAVAAYPKGCSRLIVASGENFPDALAATALAGLMNCPVMITPSAAMCDQVRTAILTLGVDNVVIVGGESAVSSAVYDSLSAVLGGWRHVDRVAGADRQATALAIYNYGMKWAKDNKAEGWGKTAIIATGMNYADALSASSYAFATKSPIFLTDSEGALSADIKAVLAESFSGAIVLGGESRVSAATYSELQTQFGEDNVSRFSGDDRYATSASFAKWAVDKGVLTYQGAAIATGKNFPDALAGAPVIGLEGSVLLLADEGGTAALDGLFDAEGDITRIRYFGGESAVSQSLRDFVESGLDWE